MTTKTTKDNYDNAKWRRVLSLRVWRCNVAKVSFADKKLSFVVQVVVKTKKNRSNMKKKYINPTMTIVKMELCNMIAASVGMYGENATGNAMAPQFDSDLDWGTDE